MQRPWDRIVYDRLKESKGQCGQSRVSEKVRCGSVQFKNRIDIQVSESLIR